MRLNNLSYDLWLASDIHCTIHVLQNCLKNNTDGIY